MALSEKARMKVLRRYRLELQRVLRSVIFHWKSNRLPDGKMAEAAASVAAISAELRSIGALPDVFRQVAEQAARLSAQNSSYAFTGFELDSFVSAAEVPIDQIAVGLDNATQGMAESVRQLMLDATTRVIPRTEAAKFISKKLRKPLHNSLNIASAGIGLIGNYMEEQVGQRMEDLGIETYYTYTGSIIPTSRSFCRRLVGKSFTREQINQLRNQHGMDVFLHCGGHGCQHQWNANSRAALRKMDSPLGSNRDVKAANNAAAKAAAPTQRIS